MPNGLKIKPSRDIQHAGRQEATRRVLYRFLRKLVFAVVILSVLNFALFLVGTLYLGGNAVKGKIEAGRYYVRGYLRGTTGYVQVSQAAFNYSKWHAYSVIVTWPFMILGAFMFSRIRRQPEDY